MFHFFPYSLVGEELETSENKGHVLSSIIFTSLFTSFSLFSSVEIKDQGII
jgi:hypothetical protein